MTHDRNLPPIEQESLPEQVDATVADVLTPYAEHEAIRLLGAISDLSDQEPLYAAAAGTLGTALLLRDGPTWRTGTRILASHLLATALRGMIKASVDRTRPDAAVERGEYVLRSGQRRDSDFNSFPSGHTAGAVAVARAVGRDHPSARKAMLALAAMAGAAQVIRSKHFITDVVAGAAVGLFAEALVDRLLRRAARI